VAQGVDRLPEIESVPYLDVVAAVSHNGAKLTLFCVNRSLNTDISTSIRLENFAAGRTAKVQVLRSESISDANDETNPTSVEPADSTEPIKAAGWSHVFPHASVSVISVERK
jgi:alpha-N-arabinofuranosidase